MLFFICTIKPRFNESQGMSLLLYQIKETIKSGVYGLKWEISHCDLIYNKCVYQKQSIKTKYLNSLNSEGFLSKNIHNQCHLQK